jgi:hypothetical protein
MDDINNTAPNLSKIKKNKQFKVPEGYFDTFPARMRDKIHEMKHEGFYEKYVLNLKPYLAIAALFIGLVVIGLITRNELNKSSIGTEPGRDEVAALIEDDIYNISEETIMEAIYANESTSDDADINGNDEDLTNEIIDYLIDENINLFDIVEAL